MALTERLEALSAQMKDTVSVQRNTLLLPYHDAYRYFFARHDLRIRGSLSDTHAHAPSAARMSEIITQIDEQKRNCLFLEPGANESLITGLDPNIHASILDPLGALLRPSTGLYEFMLERIAQTIADCR